MGPQTVYFAYGSNLCLTQMSERCPESRFLGRGILPDYRWYINTRGVANIASSKGDYVEGLCYLLSRRDETRLDIKEGVRSGSYMKETLKVEIFSASAIVVGRRCREVRNHIHREELQDQSNEKGPWLFGQTPASDCETSLYRERQSISNTHGEQVDALVYINRDQTNDGPPREEYVDRMNCGLKDALKLGVSLRFLETYIRKYIEERPGRRAEATSLHAIGDAFLAESETRMSRK